MDDMERYGDYNEVDESPTRSLPLILIKAAAAVVCLAVLGLLAFRLFTFNYYPKNVTRLYFNDSLAEFYNERGGDIGAMTQGLLDSTYYGYDDPDDGNFFCTNMVYIPELGQLQVTLRYNMSVLDKFEEKYSLSDLDPDSTELFNFRLKATRDSDPTTDEKLPDEQLGTFLDADLSDAVWESFVMYRYVRLVFDGIDFGSEAEGNSINWIRLEVRVEGDESETPHMILIYYDTDSYPFEPYKLSRDEVPRDK